MRTLRRLYALVADPEMPIYVTCPGKTHRVMYRSKKVTRHQAVMAIYYAVRESVLMAAIKVFLVLVSLPCTLFFINGGRGAETHRVGVRQRLEALATITIVAVVAAMVWLLTSGTDLRWHIAAVVSAVALVLMLIGHLILKVFTVG